MLKTNANAIHDSNYDVNVNVNGLLTITRLADTPQQCINLIREANRTSYEKVGRELSNTKDEERTKERRKTDIYRTYEGTSELFGIGAET